MQQAARGLTGGATAPRTPPDWRLRRKRPQRRSYRPPDRPGWRHQSGWSMGGSPLVRPLAREAP
eukprot:8849603-Alexandrium_andersonii.AAC.1